MMNGPDLRQEMIFVVDQKIAEIFKSHLDGYQKEESAEELKILNELKALNKKVDALTKALEKLSTTGIPAGATLPGLQDGQGRATTTPPPKPAPKKTEVFVPKLEKSDMEISVSDKTKDTKSKTSNVSMQNSLDALSKLK